MSTPNLQPKSMKQIQHFVDLVDFIDSNDKYQNQNQTLCQILEIVSLLLSIKAPYGRVPNQCSTLRKCYKDASRVSVNKFGSILSNLLQLLLDVDSVNLSIASNHQAKHEEKNSGNKFTSVIVQYKLGKLFINQIAEKFSEHINRR